MVDGNGDDERKTKYFILSIFICVFAGSFQETVVKLGWFQIFLSKILKFNESCGKLRFIEFFDPPKCSIHRIVRSTESFDWPNSLINQIFRFTELFDSPNWSIHRIVRFIDFLIHWIRKTGKKYGYNISSVNGVAEFVKERLYPYNGTEQVLLDGNALECFNIEGQGFKDWLVDKTFDFYFLETGSCLKWTVIGG